MTQLEDLKIEISNLIINNYNKDVWENEDGRLIADGVDVFYLTEKILTSICNYLDNH